MRLIEARVTYDQARSERRLGWKRPQNGLERGTLVVVDNIMNGGQAIRTRIRVKHSVGAATLLGRHERE